MTNKIFIKCFLIMLVGVLSSVSCHSGNGIDIKQGYIELIGCRWNLGTDFRVASNDPERPQWNKLTGKNLYQVSFQPEPFDIEFQKKISVVTDIKITRDNDYVLTSYKASIGGEGLEAQYFVVSHEGGTLIFVGFEWSEFLPVVGDCISL